MANPVPLGRAIAITVTAVVAAVLVYLVAIIGPPITQGAGGNGDACIRGDERLGSLTQETSVWPPEVRCTSEKDAKVIRTYSYGWAQPVIIGLFVVAVGALTLGVAATILHRSRR
jgi:hypothetical protein